MRDKQFILSEIRRTAALNGGKPVGQDRFQTETGIAFHEWRGVHWARWGDALLEAGFTPLVWGAKSGEEEIFEVLAKLVRQYGRYPTNSEILLDKRNNEKMPAPNTLVRRLGNRVEAIKKFRIFCSLRAEYSDVAAILTKETISEKPASDDREGKIGSGKLNASGYVYLARSGKLFKIGQTANRWQRMSQLDRQTFEGIDELIHTIAAYDDAPGIEAYWHKRFKEKNVRNEIFDLSAEDIRAFKKRKWM